MDDRRGGAVLLGALLGGVLLLAGSSTAPTGDPVASVDLVASGSPVIYAEADPDRLLGDPWYVTTPPTQWGNVASLVRTYESVGALRGASDALVLGQVTAVSDAMVIDLAVQRYTIRVEAVLRGEAPEVVDVYQFGDPRMLHELGGPEHLELDRRFLLYLVETGLDESEPAATGYYIVGPGAWGEVRDGDFELWVSADSKTVTGDIPKQVRLQDAQALLAE